MLNSQLYYQDPEPIKMGSGSELAEALFYYHEKKELSWVDISGRQIFRYNQGTNSLTQWNLDLDLPSCLIPLDKNIGEKNDYLITSNHNIYLWNSTDNICTLSSSLPEKLDQSIRLNDGKCDPRGRLWLGTMDIYDRPMLGGLYRYNNDNTISKKLSGISLSNGLDWSPDGQTFYYIDTPTRSVQVYRYDLNNGNIVRHIDTIDLTKMINQGVVGVPDGMTIDGEGNLWIAMWNGSSVIHIDPTYKELIAKYDLPVSKPTTCVFAGDNLDQLYVSTAYTPEEKDSGRIFKIYSSKTIRGKPCIPYSTL